MAAPVRVLSIGPIVHVSGENVNPEFRRSTSRFLRSRPPDGVSLTKRHVIIHGTGLIGASIGLGMAAGGWEVSGWDPDERAARVALDRGAIGRILPDDSAGVDDSDLLVLAGPPSATMDALRRLDTGALVTDVSSVKTPIVAAGRALPRFVPGHPMAGTAASGPEHASAHMFHGATWALCDDLAAPADIEAVQAIVTALGANPAVMRAEEHDRRVALVSHLPRILASMLIDMAEATPGALQLSAGSFKDLTRVAGSDSGWWTDVLVANREAMEGTIDAIQDELGAWRKTITAADATAIARRLEEARDSRGRLGPSMTAVRVILFDKPGEIGLVGRALEQSEVDLRDLQLRHAEYGGGGVLTLTVSDAEAPSLRQALVQNGFEIEE